MSSKKKNILIQILKNEFDLYEFFNLSTITTLTWKKNVYEQKWAKIFEINFRNGFGSQ